MSGQTSETVSFTHTHTALCLGLPRVIRYQKGKTDLYFPEARDSEWQWHQLGHMQVCTSLHTDNQDNTPPLKFFYRPDALPVTQPTVSKHWMHIYTEYILNWKPLQLIKCSVICFEDGYTDPSHHQQPSHNTPLSTRFSSIKFVYNIHWWWWWNTFVCNDKHTVHANLQCWRCCLWVRKYTACHVPYFIAY